MRWFKMLDPCLVFLTLILVQAYRCTPILPRQDRTCCNVSASRRAIAIESVRLLEPITDPEVQGRVAWVIVKHRITTWFHTVAAH